MTKPQREAHYHGLINQGATCYLNSVLQVLFMTTEIHDRLDPEKQITDKELRRLFNKLKEKTCGTENITKTLKIKNVNQQRDAAECLELILNEVSQQASEVFQGQLTYTIKCFKGHIINEETNPFWTLPLSLKDDDTTYSVESSFKRIFQTKTYTGDNMVYCNDCNDQTDATSGCEMEDPPQILILLLKRFDFDYNTMSHFKSDCCVDVPYELQLKNKMYKLYGMVDHMGSLRGGHYTATILSDKDKSWYEFDNTHVKKVKEQPFAETGPYRSRTVYLLMYRAAELQKSPETNKLEDLRQDDAEPKRSSVERDADDENKGQLRQNDTDEVQETSDEALNSQTGGEEDTAETGKNVLDDEVRSQTEPEREPSNRVKLREEKDDTAGEPECERFGSHDKDDKSVGEISHIRDMKTDENCGKASEVENSVDVEAQDNLNVNVGEQSKDSTEQHLDEEAKTDKEEQRATECQKPVETTSEDLTDEVEEEQGEDIGPAELKGDEEPKINFCERNNGETTQMGHSAEDEGQMRKDGKEERLQARGEEGDAENVETDISINNHTTVSQVKSSEDEEAQENEISNTREQRKSEDLNETRVEDASVNVGEQPKDSTEQHLDDETKTDKEEQRVTECQKPVETTSEDQTDELEEEQGEDTDPAELKGGKEPNRTTDDGETTQMGHSSEDEGQMREDRKEEGIQARGEEGDEVNVESDTSMNNLKTVSEVKSSEIKEEKENEDSNTPENSKSEELNATRVEDAFANVGEQLKDSSEQHLDKETKTDKEEQRATECQKPVETPSEDLNEFKEEQGEDIGPAELKGDEEPNRKTDDGETTQMGHSSEDEGQMRKDGKEERLQARGEEGDVETDTSINNHTTVSEVKSSEDEEAQENEISNTGEQRKSEELNETRVENASVNVGEQPKDSCEQHLDEETKTEKEEQRATECQKPVETPSEDLTEFKEEQGEDIGPAELKGDEEPKRNTDDKETTQMGHSSEDEGQMRKDGKEEKLQARGEEGDGENVETDISINNHTTVSEVKSSEDDEAQKKEISNTGEQRKSEELNETRVEDASVNVEEQPKDSCEQHLDEETKTDKEEQRATECQKPVETPSEDLTEFKEEQCEDIGPAELKGDEEPKRNTDDKETTQMGHSSEDEGQMRKDGKEEKLQARGEEGDGENVEEDEEPHRKTDDGETTQMGVSEVKSSEKKEAKENKDSNTPENSKSEELNESRVEDASANIVEQPKESYARLDEETKTEKEEERGQKKKMCPSFCNIY
ncbi:myosin-2 heavy chain-like isoform X2 [Sparus aurata]|uniref:myosin-2 heavy chain-like isoform X2 n=1 Tax=Sparus aurata TaxID=8175 RepID=UPI0011C115A2|nr:myosin-2 heavy chain-like isoform X2 [Sparus aurata]